MASRWMDASPASLRNGAACQPRAKAKSPVENSPNLCKHCRFRGQSSDSVHMVQGTIIFLNGTSSAGKTTLAHALQDLLPEPYIHVALDQFRDGMPARFRGLNAPVGTDGERGLNVVPVNESGPPFTLVQFGETGKKLLRGMRRAIVAMVNEGNNVIIDDIILEPEFLDDYLDAFEGLTVYFVGVRCPLDVINEREKSRPGRFPGTALGHFETCHSHGVYDAEVDTSVTLPDECARQVYQVIRSSPPRAFTHLLAMRQRHPAGVGHT